MSDGKRDDDKAFGKHFYDVIRGAAEQRTIEIARIAQSKGFDLNTVKELSQYEYNLYKEDLLKELTQKTNE